MIKTLDKYIIKKYLATFFFAMLIFTLIAVIIDLSAKIDDFIEEDVTLFQIIKDYYLNWVLWINGLLFPLYALISVVFFTSRMAYNSEIISILNAGVSFNRLMRPYLIAGLFIFVLHFVGNHIVIPAGNKIHYDFQHTYIFKYDDKGKTNDVHLFIEPGTKVYIDRYSKGEKKAKDFRIEKFEKGELVYIMKSEYAKWLGPPNKWSIHNYTIRTFYDGKEEIINGEGQQIDTTINLTPKDFVRYVNHKDLMNTGELKDFINTENQRGVGNTKKFEVEVHRRTADPITILILTIIGLAVSARKIRGGMGFHLALGVAIGAIYIFLSKFSITFATNERLPPILGVWIPNIIFMIVAFVLVRNAQK